MNEFKNVTESKRIEVPTAQEALKKAEGILSQSVKMALYYGATINAETMSGSQGEKAKVDVRLNSGRIARMAIFESSEWGNGKGFVVYTVIHGFAPEWFKPGFFGTLWNHDLVDVEVVEIVGERECC